VQPTGPGIDSTIAIKEVDDFYIVEAPLRKYFAWLSRKATRRGPSGGWAVEVVPTSITIASAVLAYGNSRPPDAHTPRDWYRR
jgi:hypothetical protein